MCTFNGVHYLRQQLESLAAQTRLPDELIVCDDCSTDETLQILEEFCRSAPFPVLLRVNEETLGSTRNFEQAASLCTGELIAFSDQDDVWKAEKLKLIEAEFEKRPDVGLVFTDAEIVDEGLGPTGRFMWCEIGFREREKELIRKGRAVEVLLPGWSVTGATMAFRAKFRDLIFPIPTDLPMIHDGWIALMIAAVAPIEFIDRPLILYRQHSGQQVGAPINQGGRLRNTTKLEFLKNARRANSYRELVDTIQKVKERWLARPAYHRGQETLAVIDLWLKHIKARTNLPAGVIARLTAVARELLTGRYHRFSSGAASAGKDLYYGACKGRT